MLLLANLYSSKIHVVVSLYSATNGVLTFFCNFYRKIKIWDFKAALDPETPDSSLCLKTLSVCPHLNYKLVHAYMCTFFTCI